MSDLMTFIGGAAVGTLVTYLSKNEDARKTVERFIDKTGEAFTGFVQRVTPGEKVQKADAETEPVNETVVKAKPAKPAKKATRPRRVAKAKKVNLEEKSVH